MLEILNYWLFEVSASEGLQFYFLNFILVESVIIELSKAQVCLSDAKVWISYFHFLLIIYVYYPYIINCQMKEAISRSAALFPL